MSQEAAANNTVVAARLKNFESVKRGWWPCRITKEQANQQVSIQLIRPGKPLETREIRETHLQNISKDPVDNLIAEHSAQTNAAGEAWKLLQKVALLDKDSKVKVSDTANMHDKMIQEVHEFVTQSADSIIKPDSIRADDIPSESPADLAANSRAIIVVSDSFSIGNTNNTVNAAKLLMEGAATPTTRAPESTQPITRADFDALLASFNQKWEVRDRIIEARDRTIEARDKLVEERSQKLAERDNQFNEVYRSFKKLVLDRHALQLGALYYKFINRIRSTLPSAAAPSTQTDGQVVWNPENRGTIEGAIAQMGVAISYSDLQRLRSSWHHQKRLRVAHELVLDDASDAVDSISDSSRQLYSTILHDLATPT